VAEVGLVKGAVRRGERPAGRSGDRSEGAAAAGRANSPRRRAHLEESPAPSERRYTPSFAPRFPFFFGDVFPSG